MKCDIFNECPLLYQCQNYQCVHQPLFESSLLAPLLTSFNNIIGISSIWVGYIILIDTLNYLPQQTWNMISGVALGASIVNIVFRIFDKNNEESQHNFHYYFIEVCTPPLIIGVNFGIQINKLEPFIVSISLGVLTAIVIIVVLANQYKEFRAEQKIALGYFKKLLPTRYISPQKRKTKTLEIQMSCIEQVDSQGDTLSHQIRVSERLALLQQMKDQHPHKHILIIAILTIFYGLICIVPVFLIVQNNYINLLIMIAIMLAFLAIGQLILYHCYIKEKIQKEQINKIDLRVNLSYDKMMKLVCISLAAGIIQGVEGFGCCEIIFIFMIVSKMSIFNTILTISYFSLLISLVYTLNSFLCSPFNIVQFFSILGYTMFATCLLQYLLIKFWISKLDKATVRSSLILILIAIQIMAMVSAGSSIFFISFRFGSSEYLNSGEIILC